MRTAIITGGTGGLGAAVTRRFLDDGWRVVVPWVARARARARRARTSASSWSQADLFDPDAVARGRATSRATSTRAVVNLVGGFHAGGRVHESPVADLQAQLRAEPRARVARHRRRAAGDARRRRGRDRLRLLAHGAAAVLRRRGVRRRQGRGARASSTRCTSSTSQDGIRANAILPSVIDTPANRASMPDADPATWVTPQQIAATIARARAAPTPRRRAAPTSPSTEGPEPCRTPAARRPTPDPAAQACAAAIDLGGTRSRRSCSTTQHTVLGRGRAGDAARGRAGRPCVDALVGDDATRGARGRRARRPASSPGSASARRGRSTPRRHRRQRPQPAGLDRPVPARRRSSRSALGGRAGAPGQRRERRDRAASTSSARAAGTTRSSASGGAPASAAASCSAARCGTGAAYAGEFGHQVIRRGGDLCGCGNRGCVEAYAGRKMMEALGRASQAGRRATTPTSSRSWRSAAATG